MPGTKAGGAKARDTNLKNNPNFYQEFGRRGGLAKKTKPHGFMVMDKDKLKQASIKGGSTSRRGPKEHPSEEV